MTLTDKIDKEIDGVNENVTPVVLGFSFLDAAEAYIRSHPSEPYGIILNSGDSKEMIQCEMKKYVYGKILTQLVQEHEMTLPNPSKYTRWVEKQKELVENIPYCYGLRPEEMKYQYSTWINKRGQHSLMIKEVTENIGKTLKEEKSEQLKEKNYKKAI